MPESYFQKQLKDYYQLYKRELPWRQTKNPYHIWISEIMLQQTRVEQVLSYYYRFIEKYPTIEDLAEAPEDSILKNWEGLGYYNRARNLHYTAKYIAGELKGQFPVSYSGLLKLKGVGKYTAAAISSFSFNEAQPVLDGNVFRVLARFLGIKEPINSTKGKKVFREAAEEMLDREEPSSYNQAIMEFGALQCVPYKPDCNSCPVKEKCYAYMMGETEKLPQKLRKRYNRQRFFNYLMIQKGKNLVVSKRNKNDIWKNLFEFPLIEEEKKSIENFPSLESFFKRTPDFIVQQRIELKPHKLTHQTIYINVWQLELVKEQEAQLKGKGLKWWSIKELRDLAFPSPLRKFLNKKPLPLPSS